MIFCIGKVGCEPRFLETNDAEDGPRQVGDGEVCFKIAARPAGRVVLGPDYTFATFEPPLAEIQLWFWQKAKEYRDQKMMAGFTSAYGATQTDATSLTRINTAAVTAMSDADFTVDWTMADDTIQPLTAAEVISLNAQATAYVVGCHAAGVAIRGAIYAATTVAALEAIDIRAGYPA